jgi:5-methylcytosine-specific restriction enzyme subunit McrC
MMMTWKPFAMPRRPAMAHYDVALARQLGQGLTLRTQARSLSLVRHLEKDWFRLKPDLLVQESKVNRLVLDTKWKLIDGQQATGSEKYGLDQGDFYQLHAYGQNYLDGDGDVVLIYPKTDAFKQALPVFEFPKSSGLRLWVLPFSLKQQRLQLPSCGSLNVFFVDAETADSVVRKIRIPASVNRLQTVTSSS